MNQSAAPSGSVSAIDQAAAGKNARPEKPQSRVFMLCLKQIARMSTTGSATHGPRTLTSGSATHMYAKTMATIASVCGIKASYQADTS